MGSPAGGLEVGELDGRGRVDVLVVLVGIIAIPCARKEAAGMSTAAHSTSVRIGSRYKAGKWLTL